MKPAFHRLAFALLAVAVKVLPTVHGFVSPQLEATAGRPMLISRPPKPTSTPISTTAMSSLLLHAVPPEVWTSFLPPVMGFVKSEWTVSYGYGFATSLSALSLLKRVAPATAKNPVFLLQATALVFYGFRLNAFLYLRNRISARMQEFQKSMEERATKRGNRLSRAPIVVSCGLLYYALYAPLLLTSMLLGSGGGSTAAVPPVALTAMKCMGAMQWCGFLMGAIADATKTYVKRSEKDEKFLVTSGIFSFLRHPNYTGEIIAWTSNSMLGALAGSYLLRSKFSSKILGYLGLNLVGWIGIVFVLLGATGSVEERQKTTYGDTDKYKKWVDSTWSGWFIPKTASTSSESHEITIDDETEEESGTGI